MLTVQLVAVLFLDERHRLCQPLPLGAGLNGEVNCGAGERLRGVERLIGFVDHLSSKEEVGWRRPTSG